MQLFQPNQFREAYQYVTKYIGLQYTCRVPSTLSVQGAVLATAGLDPNLVKSIGRTGGKMNMGVNRRDIIGQGPVFYDGEYYYGLHAIFSSMCEPFTGRVGMLGRIAICRHRSKNIFNGGFRYGAIWTLANGVFMNLNGQKEKFFVNKIPNYEARVRDMSTAMFFGTVNTIREVAMMQRAESFESFFFNDQNYYGPSESGGGSGTPGVGQGNNQAIGRGNGYR